jgi:hypothetical protein
MQTKPKFRASGNGHLMTEPKLKADKDAGNLSEGAKTHVINTWVSWKYKRNEEIYSKYIEKGNEVEEDAITTVSLASNVNFVKNEITFENEWICGTPDFLIKDKEGKIITIEDTKASWDIYSFNRSKNKPLNKLYYWQMQSYMWLTGATMANIRYCLENATADLILDEKRKLAYAMRCFGEQDTNPEYKAKCAQLERLMIYDMKSFKNRYPGFDFDCNLAEWKYDVPENERLYTIPIYRNDSDIENLKSKVIKAWEFMENL